MQPHMITLGGITIYTYGVLIALGATLGYFYISKEAKALGISTVKFDWFCAGMIISAVLGGRLFFYMTAPDYYFTEPSRLLENPRTGFVFFGSLLFLLPTAIWFFRKEQWPIWPLLDSAAITIPIVHGIGRIGCFFSGCCYGIPTDSVFGVQFSHPLSKAKPLNVTLHPTQLYEALLIFSILVLLWQLKKRQKMRGRLIFIYIGVYGLGRSIIEFFRGDVERGLIAGGAVSQSQVISVVLIASALFLFLKFKNHSTSSPNQ